MKGKLTWRDSLNGTEIIFVYFSGFPSFPDTCYTWIGRELLQKLKSIIDYKVMLGVIYTSATVTVVNFQDNYYRLSLTSTWIVSH